MKVVGGTSAGVQIVIEGGMGMGDICSGRCNRAVTQYKTRRMN